MQNIFDRIFQWLFSLLEAMQSLGAFLFTPLSDSIDLISELENWPNWVQSVLSVIVDLFGDISPIWLIGGIGIIVGIIIMVIKAFL